MLFPTQVEVSCPKEMAWKVNMYRGYLAICHPEEQQLSFIERLVEMASSLAIREWRRLPHVVSHVHTPLLQVGPSRGAEGAFSRGALLGEGGLLHVGPGPGVGGPCSIRVLRAVRRGAPSCLCGDSPGAGGPCSVHVVMGPEAGGPILSVW